MARPSQRDLNKVSKQANNALGEAARRLVGGVLTPEGFYAQAQSILVSSYTRASVLGRQRGGDLTHGNEDDREQGRRIFAAHDAPYLQAFAADIAGGRYTDGAGDLDAERIRRRAELYTLKLPSVANEALIGTDSTAALMWVLGPTEHCGECVTLSEGSPYTFDTLPTFPRMGATPCLFNCACEIKREGGASLFQ